MLAALALPSFAASRPPPWLLPARADLSAHSASELHRSSCQDGTVFPVSSSFDQLRIGNPLTVCGSEHRVDAITFPGFAAIVAPREFVEVAIEMFGADEVVDAKHLSLEVRPRAASGPALGGLMYKLTDTRRTGSER